MLQNHPKKHPKTEKKAPENRAIYVTNIPRDATVEELADVFKKYGMIDQGVDGKPRIKLYTDDDGEFNGEALIVYFKKESVDLAIRLQDDYELRLGDTKNGTLRVQEADNSRRKNTDAEKIAGKLVRKERKTAERTRAEMQRQVSLRTLSMQIHLPNRVTGSWPTGLTMRRNGWQLAFTTK